MRGWQYHENTEQAGGYSVGTDVCRVMTDWWYAHYSNHVCECHIHTSDRVNISFCYFFFSFPTLQQVLSWSYITHHPSRGLASDPHSSTLSQGKHLQHEEGKRLHQQPYSSLFPHCLPFFLTVSLSLCLCLSVLQHWQDLLAPGSCYAHNILDQSSLVIGQAEEKRSSCHRQRYLGPAASTDSQRNWPLL